MARIMMVLAAVIVASAVGCSSPHESGAGTPSPIPVPTPAPPRVVVTTDVLGDVVRNVLGDQAEIETLMPPGTDPLTFHRSDAQLRSIAQAQLIVAVGLLWEITVTAPIEAAKLNGTPVLEVAASLNPIPLGGTELAPVPSAGASAGAADPRVWLDPDRMSRAARLVADAAIRLPGVDAAEVTARLTAYQAQIAHADEQIQGFVAEVPPAGRYVVTASDSMGYFADRYGFTIAGVLQPGPPFSSDASGSLVSPGAVDPEAHAAHVRAVVATIRADHLPVIVTDRRDPRATLDAAVAALGPCTTSVLTLDLDALGPAGSGADTYLGLITTNARSLVDALKGG